MIVAAVVRLPGFLWGLPDSTHLFSYHPDEFHSLRGAFALAEGDPNPHFFNYGCLYLYAVAAACVIAHPSMFTGPVPAALTPYGMPRALRLWTIDARIVSLLFALGTVVAVAVAAQALGAEPLWAALAMALMPLHALHSRYGTVDVTAAFFVTLAVAAAARSVARPSAAVWAGAFSGLAASTKYAAWVVMLAPLAAIAMHSALPMRRRALLGLACCAAAVAAFVVTSPYVVLAWSEARADIAFEIRHMRIGEFPAKAAEPFGWWFHLKWLAVGTGGLGLAGLAGLVWAAARREQRRRALPVALVAVVTFAVISAAGVRYARYELPLLPLAAIGIGLLATRRGDDQAGTQRPEAGLAGAGPLQSGTQRLRAACRCLVGALFSLALCHSLFIGWRLMGPDTRDEALRYIVAVSEPDEAVGMIWQPWFQSPPLDFVNGGEGLRSGVWRMFERPLREVVVVGYDAQALRQRRPEWFVVSEVEERDYKLVGAKSEFWQELSKLYRTERAWAQGPFETLVPRALRPPQDWLYPTMPLRVLRRTD